MADNILKVPASEQLRQVANQERDGKLIPINEYKPNSFEYSATNPNAISDGDEKGKGENGNDIGSSIDIQNRIDNVGRNRFNKENNYSSINKDALSDGDEKGKGELDGKVGSLTDIKSRTDVVARNKYNSSKRYPDF